jgi:hypothetical protein
MGFHKRYLTNKLIIDVYHNQGKIGLEKLLSGADAYMFERGIASALLEIYFNSNYSLKDRDIAIDKLFIHDIYTKG